VLLAAAMFVTGPAAVDPPSPANGRAAVVAQGLVAFRAGQYHWEVETVAVASAATIAVAGATFVLGDGPGSVLVGPSGAPPTWRLAPGEAALYDSGDSLVALADGPAGGSITLIAPAPGGGDEAFSPGATVRDVDLVRDVLAPDEVLRIDSEISALVLVASGTVGIGDARIQAGNSLPIAGEFIVSNPGAGEAVVFTAVIGPPVAGEFAP
jgi:hypothetical protein